MSSFFAVKLDNALPKFRCFKVIMFVVFKESSNRKGAPVWLITHMSSSMVMCVRSALKLRSRTVLCVEKAGLQFALIDTQPCQSKSKSLPPWCVPWYRARVPRQFSRLHMAHNPRRWIMKTALFTLAAILACSVGANGYLAYVATKSNYMSEIEAKRSRINDDMVSEMIWTRFNSYDQNQMELARMQGYNEGINAVVQKVDPQQSQISAIWHAGYQRGLEQSNFMQYMKAINFTSSWPDSMLLAIKEFANAMMKKDSDAPQQKPEGK